MTDSYLPAEMWPTKDGGHTYLGFTLESNPRFWGLIKGKLKPVPTDNWKLLSDELKAEFRAGAISNGMRIEADD